MTLNTLSDTTSAVAITEAQQRQYQDEGYFLLESGLSKEEIEILRKDCLLGVAEIDAQMDAAGTDVMGITHRNSRYFVGNRVVKSPAVRSVLFGNTMAAICRATLGPDVWLFNEQFVVKSAEKGRRFAWHQDSGYIGHDHRPYLSIWIALDATNSENGTVFILPYSRAGTRARQEHEREEESNDLVGYHGGDPGEPVILPPGGMAVFSSTTFHRSGANTSPDVRRIYLAQYSAEPIMNRDRTALWGHAIPFLRAGENIFSEPPQDAAPA